MHLESVRQRETLYGSWILPIRATNAAPRSILPHGRGLLQMEGAVGSSERESESGPEAALILSKDEQRTVTQRVRTIALR
jgi:hypothetical protein